MADLKEQCTSTMLEVVIMPYGDQENKKYKLPGMKNSLRPRLPGQLDVYSSAKHMQHAYRFLIPPHINIYKQAPSRKDNITVKLTGKSSLSPEYGNCCMSPFKHLEYGGGSYISRKFMKPCQMCIPTENRITGNLRKIPGTTCRIKL